MDNKQEFQPTNIRFERRRFKRVNGTYVVSYAPIKGEEVKFDVSQTRDLSEGGLLFIADKKFENGTMLKIKLRLPEFADYVIVKAQVVGSDQVAKGLMHKARVQFIEMDQKVKDAIKRLVDNA
jgi:c-di-GMP-binding flagellar brake protein YcgR